MTETVDDTLENRDKIYGGSFLEQSAISQQLKAALHQAPNWKRMRVDQREALEMISTKMSRLLYGDPNWVDSWHDIAGYARLIEKELLSSKEKRENS